jgi:hypothetical protein
MGFNPAIAAHLAEKLTFIMLLSVSICVHPWFSSLFCQSFSLAG